MLSVKSPQFSNCPYAKCHFIDPSLTSFVLQSQPSLPLFPTTNPSVVCSGNRTKRTFYYLNLLISLLLSSHTKRGPLSVNLGSKFTRVFNLNLFHGKESLSEVGSNLDQTQELINLLPAVSRELEVKSILDLPCGDFNWMSKGDFSRLKHTGADIVLPLVNQLNSKFGSLDRKFLRLNLVAETPSKYDAVFSCDLLVHLNNKDALNAIQNVVASGSKYFLSTTFFGLKSNCDLPVITRKIAWRPSKLVLSPFNFPSSLQLINEKCSESIREFSDKSIGIWKVSDLDQFQIE